MVNHSLSDIGEDFTFRKTKISGCWIVDYSLQLTCILNCLHQLDLNETALFYPLPSKWHFQLKDASWLNIDPAT